MLRAPEGRTELSAYHPTLYSSLPLCVLLDMSSPLYLAFFKFSSYLFLEAYPNLL